MIKKCNRCGRNINNINNRKYCKKCRKIREKEWAKNPNKRENNLRWKEKNRERLRAEALLYYKKNNELIKKKNKLKWKTDKNFRKKRLDCHKELDRQRRARENHRQIVNRFHRFNSLMRILL